MEVVSMPKPNFMSDQKQLSTNAKAFTIKQNASLRQFRYPKQGHRDGRFARSSPAHNANFFTGLHLKRQPLQNILACRALEN
jgi:hypothetical protein